MAHSHTVHLPLGALLIWCTMCGTGINALVATVGMAALGKSGLLIPHRDIFNSGVSQMLAMAASNEALRYVSYPTQVHTQHDIAMFSGRPLMRYVSYPTQVLGTSLPKGRSCPSTRLPTLAGARQVVQDGAGDGGRHRARRQALLDHRVPAGAPLLHAWPSSRGRRVSECVRA